MMLPIGYYQKILGRQTGESSVTYQSHALVSVAVTCSVFFIMFLLLMQHSNGQGAVLNGHLVRTTGGTRKVLKVKVSLTPSQAQFIDFVLFHGLEVFSRSLKKIHDLALYHSDVPFDEEEKSALFDLKLLWEEFERVAEDA